jgi:hypothetical protein
MISHSKKGCDLPGIGDIFVGFFGNIFNDVMMLVFLLIGIIVGILLRPRWHNTVMKLMPQDRRFVDFDIAQETAISVVCKDKKGYPPHRFLKIAEGFIGDTGFIIKRAVTRYIGKEGTAYLWTVDQDQFKRIEGGMPSYLKNLWGEQTYNEMPEDLRQKVETDKVLVTVDLSDGLTPPGMRSLGEEDIKREEDRQACETLWAGKRREERGTWISNLIIGLAGFGIACFLMVVGVLKLPVTVVPGPPTNSTGG